MVEICNHLVNITIATLSQFVLLMEVLCSSLQFIIRVDCGLDVKFIKFCSTRPNNQMENAILEQQSSYWVNLSICSRCHV